MLTTEYLTTIYVNDAIRTRHAEAEHHRQRRLARRHRSARRQRPAAECG